MAAQDSGSRDVDIYADIVDYSHDEVEQLLATCRRLHADNQRLVAAAAELRARLAEQEKSRGVLRRSFSSLMLTARAEIARKDARLEELQRLLDHRQLRCQGRELSELVHREARRLASEWSRVSPPTAPDAGPGAGAQRRRRTGPRHSDVVASMHENNVTVQAANLSFSLATDQVPWSRRRMVQLASPHRRQRRHRSARLADSLCLEEGRQFGIATQLAPQLPLDTQQPPAIASETVDAMAMAPGTASKHASKGETSNGCVLAAKSANQCVFSPVTASSCPVMPEAADERPVKPGGDHEGPVAPERANECLAMSGRTGERLAMPERTNDRSVGPERASERAVMPERAGERSTIPVRGSERSAIPERASERHGMPERASECSVMTGGTSPVNERPLVSEWANDRPAISEGTVKRFGRLDRTSERTVISKSARRISMFQPVSKRISMPVSSPEAVSRSNSIPGTISRKATPEAVSRSKSSPEMISRSKSTPEAMGRNKLTPEVFGRSKPTPETVSRSEQTPEAVGRNKLTSEEVVRSKSTLEVVDCSKPTPDAAIHKSAPEAISHSKLTPETVGRSESTPEAVILNKSAPEAVVRSKPMPEAVGRSEWTPQIGSHCKPTSEAVSQSSSAHSAISSSKRTSEAVGCSKPTSEAVSRDKTTPEAISHSKLTKQTSEAVSRNKSTPDAIGCLKTMAEPCNRHFQASATGRRTPPSATAIHPSPDRELVYHRVTTSEPARRHSCSPDDAVSERQMADFVRSVAGTGAARRQGSLSPEASRSVTEVPPGKKRHAKRLSDSEATGVTIPTVPIATPEQPPAKRQRKATSDPQSASRRKRPRVPRFCENNESELIIDVQFCVASAASVSSDLRSSVLAPTASEAPARFSAEVSVPNPALASASTRVSAPAFSTDRSSAPCPAIVPALARDPAGTKALPPVPVLALANALTATSTKAHTPASTPVPVKAPASTLSSAVAGASVLASAPAKTPASVSAPVVFPAPTPALPESSGSAAAKSSELNPRQLQLHMFSSLNTSTESLDLPRKLPSLARSPSQPPITLSADSPSVRLSSPASSAASSGAGGAYDDSEFQLDVDLNDDDLDYEPESPLRRPVAHASAAAVGCAVSDPAVNLPAGTRSHETQTTACSQPDNSPVTGDRGKSSGPSIQRTERFLCPPTEDRERPSGPLTKGNVLPLGSPADREGLPSGLSAESKRRSPVLDAVAVERSPDLPVNYKRKSPGPSSDGNGRFPGSTVDDKERALVSFHKGIGRSIGSFAQKNRGETRGSPTECRGQSPDAPARGPAAEDKDSAIEEGEIVDGSPVKLPPRRPVDADLRCRWPVGAPVPDRHLDLSDSPPPPPRTRLPLPLDRSQSPVGWRRQRAWRRGRGTARSSRIKNTAWHWTAWAEERAERQRRESPVWSPSNAGGRSLSSPRSAESAGDRPARRGGRSAITGRRLSSAGISEEQAEEEGDLHSRLFAAADRPAGSQLRLVGAQGRKLGRYLDAFINNQTYCEDSVSQAEPPAKIAPSGPTADGSDRGVVMAVAVSATATPASSTSVAPSAPASVAGALGARRRRRRRGVVQLGDSECTVMTVAAAEAERPVTPPPANGSRRSESPDTLERLVREAEGVCGVPDLLTGEDSEMSLLSFCH